MNEWMNDKSVYERKKVLMNELKNRRMNDWVYVWKKIINKSRVRMSEWVQKSALEWMI